jgi:hypothetical protein
MPFQAEKANSQISSVLVAVLSLELPVRPRVSTQLHASMEVAGLFSSVTGLRVPIEMVISSLDTRVRNFHENEG